MINSKFFVLIILSFSLVSCLEETPDEQTQLADRTVLFYLAGDNSLAEESNDKLAALTEAWNVEGENNHLLVYHDGGESAAPRLLEIVHGEQGGGGQVRVLEEYEQENSASVEVFVRVLNSMVNLFPGSDYGLVVFSHGSGWLPEGTYANSRSVVMDGIKELDVKEFAKSIPNGRFRFVLFESCLMASVEVAYELMGKTDYILASSAEVLSPGFTPLYGQMLPLLFNKTPLLEKCAKLYFDYYSTQQGSNRSATVSLIKTSELAPLKKLIASAETHVEHWEWVERKDIQAFDRKEIHLFYDLAGYIANVGTEKEAAAVDSVLKKAVVYKEATKTFLGGREGTERGFDILTHCGLTIYIPVAKYEYMNNQRKLLKLFSEYAGE